MKVQKVTLKEVDVIDVKGEYETRFINEKQYPAFLTHYALKKAKEEGVVTSSLFNDLVKLQSLQGMEKGKIGDLSVLAEIDEENMQRVIYVAIKGANKNEELTFDYFLERYHEDLVNTIELYTNLVIGLVNKDPNQFASAFQKNTNSGSKGEKK